jgi:hypothetical protein
MTCVASENVPGEDTVAWWLQWRSRVLEIGILCLYERYSSLFFTHLSEVLLALIMVTFSSMQSTQTEGKDNVYCRKQRRIPYVLEGTCAEYFRVNVHCPSDSMWIVNRIVLSGMRLI